jgi:hypothetical protein
MAMLNDPENDRFRFRRRAEETSYTVWLVGGGLLALALVMGAFVFMSNSTDQTSTAANRLTEPTTTGFETPNAAPKVAPAAPATPAPAQPAPAR